MASQAEVSLVTVGWYEPVKWVGLYTVFHPVMAITKISLFLLYVACNDHICLYMRVQDNAGINVWHTE